MRDRLQDPCGDTIIAIGKVLGCSRSGWNKVPWIMALQSNWQKISAPHTKFGGHGNPPYSACLLLQSPRAESFVQGLEARLKALKTLPSASKRIEPAKYTCTPFSRLSCHKTESLASCRVHVNLLEVQLHALELASHELVLTTSHEKEGFDAR